MLALMNLMCDQVKAIMTPDTTAADFARELIDLQCMRANLAKPLSLAQIAKAARFSEDTVRTMVKANTTVTPVKFAKTVREQQIDGTQMPAFELVAKYLGPSGGFVTTEKDGWFMSGCLLQKKTSP